MRIGIDCGGVLFVTNTKFEPEFSEDADRDEPEAWMPGAKEALEELKQQGHELFVVSFCGKRRALETREKLLEIRHLIPPKNVFL